MSNLEHLIENSLIVMERCDGYDDWHEHIKDDPNWDNIWVSIGDLWTICQYVIYTWCAMRCEKCTGKWINREKCQVDEDAYEVATCSECGAEITIEYPYDSYCPNCGTKMKGGEA